MERGFSFNWRQSPAHVYFLTTFLKPRQPNDHFLDENWQLLLGEPPQQAIERFQALGLLVRASLHQRLDYQFTKVQLKEMLRQRQLPVGGNKDALIARLIQADRPGMLAAVNVELFQCSDRGRAMAEAYLADPQSLLYQAGKTAGQSDNRRA